MIRRAFIRALSGAILTTLLGVKAWRLEASEGSFGDLLLAMPPEPMYVRFLDDSRYIIGFEYHTIPGIMWTSEQVPYRRRNAYKGNPMIQHPDSHFYPVLWEPRPEL